VNAIPAAGIDSKVGMASVDVPAPEHSDVRLAIAVNDGKLSDVYFGDLSLPDLCTDEVNGRMPPDGCHGGLGVYAEISSAVFRDAVFVFYERRRP
jgi:hypothetical protein